MPGRQTVCVTVHKPSPTTHPNVRKRSIQSLAEKILTEEGLEGVEVEIVLVDDQTIWDLNRTYRGRDRPTDVLAFSMSEGEGADLTPSLLGEVYVSLDRAAIQAQEYDVPFHEEVARLVIHGLLHLVGYTHAAMVDKEDQFLTMWRG